MGKWIIVLIIFVIIVGGLIYFLYKDYEKPKQQIILDEINISIAALDDKDNFVKTGYKISYDGISRYGNTSDRAYTQERALYNKSVLISNVNNGDQRYYIEENNIFLNGGDRTKRLDIHLQKAVLPVISQSAEMNNNIESFDLIIEGKGLYQNPGFCIDYSTHFIYFKVLANLIEIENPEYLKSFYKCYSLGIEKLENGQNINIPINYKIFGSLNSEDFVNIVVFDDETFYKKYNFLNFRITQKEGSMILNVQSINEYQNPYVCIGYSEIFNDLQINKSVNDINQQISENDKFEVVETNKPQYLESPYKCYNLGIVKLNKNQGIALPIYYKISENLKGEDFINIIVFDDSIFSNQLKINQDTGGFDVYSNLTII